MAAKRRASESRARELRRFLQQADDCAWLAGDAGRGAREIDPAPARPWPVGARGRLRQATAHGAAVHPFDAVRIVAAKALQRRLRRGRRVGAGSGRVDRNRRKKSERRAGGGFSRGMFSHGVGHPRSLARAIERSVRLTVSLFRRRGRDTSRKAGRVSA